MIDGSIHGTVCYIHDVVIGASGRTTGIASLCLLAGCGRIGFDQTGGVTDAATGDVASVGCTTFGPFDPPVQVPELSSPVDDSAVSLSADQLYVMLERQFAGNLELFQASRPSIDSPFSTPIRVPELDTPDHESNPSLSPDGLTVYFARSQNLDPGFGVGQIYVATRSDRTSPFSIPVPVSINVTDMNDVCAPEISDDGQELIFNRYASVIQNSNLMRAVWNPQSAQFEAAPSQGLVELSFGTPTSDHLEAWASLSAGGRTILYAVAQCASGGNPCPAAGETFRIYTADRPAPGAPFGTPRLLSELPSEVGASDGDPELSADGKTLWFSSNRMGGAGSFDVWKATRACL